MFTGIIQAIGKLSASHQEGSGLRLCIEGGRLDLGDVTVGDSIAVNGVCLTVVTLGGGGFSVEVSRETLGCTTLGALGQGSSVNLEKALRLSDRLDGHLVTGHVDGVGAVSRLERQGASVRLAVKVPERLARYICRKGSVCIDGVSLTVNSIGEAGIELQLIPHTLRETTLGGYQLGSRVNIEVDIIARYLESLLLTSKDVR